MTRESDIPTLRVVQALLSIAVLVAAIFAMTAAPAFADEHECEVEWKHGNETAWHPEGHNPNDFVNGNPWQETGNTRNCDDNGDNDDEPEHKVWVCVPDEYFEEEVASKGHGDNPVWINWNAQGGWQETIRNNVEDDVAGFFIVDGSDSSCEVRDDDDDDDNGGGGSSSSSSTSGEVQVLGEVLGESLAFTGVDASSLILMTAAGLAAVGGGTMLLRRTRVIGSGGSADLTD